MSAEGRKTQLIQLAKKVRDDLKSLESGCGSSRAVQKEQEDKAFAVIAKALVDAFDILTSDM